MPDFAAASIAPTRARTYEEVVANLPNDLDPLIRNGAEPLRMSAIALARATKASSPQEAQRAAKWLAAQVERAFIAAYTEAQ